MARSISRGGAMGRSQLRRQRGFFDYVLREGSVILFTAALFYVLWGGYQAQLATPAEAMWSVFVAAAACMGYVFAQALAAAALPQRREAGPIGDVLVSLLPLLVVGYTLIDWMRDISDPEPFKVIVLLLASIAALIDLVVFTWYSIRLNRLTPDRG